MRTGARPQPARLVAGMLAVAGACWVVTLARMRGMDMGAGTDLGSLAFFLGVWTPMMAAMMLPGAVPAVSRFVAATGRIVLAPLFAGAYLALWTVAGLALGVMSATVMAVVAAVVLAQKLLPPRASIDVPVAVAIVALGTLVIVAPASVPGFVRAM
jgi:predicted metal-binding membrane protein